MATAELIIEGFERDFGLTRDSATEFYLCRGVQSDELDNPGTITGLPLPGSSIGQGAGFPVQSTRLVKVLTQQPPHDAVFAVTAGTYGSGTIYGARSARMVGTETKLLIPKLTLQSITFGSGGPKPHYVPDYIETVRIGNELILNSMAFTNFTALNNFNARNTGKRYVLSGSNPGISYFFKQAMGTQLQNGQFRVEGVFYTTSAMPAMAANSPLGFGVDVPALANLDEYTVNWGTFPPSIGVLPVTRFPLGESYPW
jgi:hypothetical protein